MMVEEAVILTVDAFGSVGMDELTVVVRERSGRVVTPFLDHHPIKEVRQKLSGIVADANRYECSVTIRPYSKSMAFIQLDDVDEAVLKFFEPIAFIRIRTSPGSYQAWLAIPSQGNDADLAFKRRIKRGNLDGFDPHGVAVSEATRARGTLSDTNASESVRCPGSMNFKEKYRANGFPVISVRTNPGRITSREELEAFDILAVASESIASPVEKPAENSTPLPYGTKRTPDYQRCLRDVPRKGDGSQDRSKADIQWAFFATQMNWDEDEIASWLNCNSARAGDWIKDRGAKAWGTECEHTAQNAAGRARSAKANYLRSRGRAA